MKFWFLYILTFLEKRPTDVLKTSPRDALTSVGWRSWDVRKTSILNKFNKTPFCGKIFDFSSLHACIKYCKLLLNTIILNTKSLLLHDLSILEKRPENVLKTSQSDIHCVTSLGRHLDVNVTEIHEISLFPYFQCISDIAVQK